jgi:hypothetical protein
VKYKSVLTVLSSSYMNECLLRDKTWDMADNLYCKAQSCAVIMSVAVYCKSFYT